MPIFFSDGLFDSTASRSSTCSIWTAFWAIVPRQRRDPAFFDVKKCRYRLRLYNPGPSRWYEFALYDGSKLLPFWQISSDGNLLPQAISVTSVRVAVAERVDIIVDFSKIAASRIYLVNRLEQVNGRGPTGKVLNPGSPFVQINLTGDAVSDDSVDPRPRHC